MDNIDYEKEIQRLLKASKFNCIDSNHLKVIIKKISKDTITDEQASRIKLDVIHSEKFDYFKEGSYYSLERGSCHYVKNNYLCLKNVWSSSLEMKEKRKWESWVISDKEQKVYQTGKLEY